VNARRRTAWILSTGEVAGMGRHALDVAGGGIPGWDLVFVVPDGPLRRQLEATGHPVLSHPDIGPGHPTSRWVPALGRLIRQVRPSVLHTHLAWADLAVAVVAPPRSRLFTTEHGIADVPGLYHETHIKASARRAMHAIRLRRTSGLIAVSDATLAAVRKHWRPPAALPTVVVRNGIDPPDAVTALPGLRFGVLGRLAKEKNPEMVLDAFARVRDLHPDASLDIAGQGPLEDALRESIARRGLADAVRLRGFRASSEFLSEIDVLVQFSEWENCSYSLLEAIASGRGVVATDVGGNPEMLPVHCLVRVGDADGAARQMLEQALELGARPGLPSGWPTVESMCASIAEFYASPSPSEQIVEQTQEARFAGMRRETFLPAPPSSEH
jgi:glycosyltransferase involved in cell wall biosynthesis